METELKTHRLYIVSGWGADHQVFSRLDFPPHLEIVHLPWKIPTAHETWASYLQRMGEGIRTDLPFSFLGYSMGGLVVQELALFYPQVEHIVILGSVRNTAQMPGRAHLIKKFDLLAKVPVSLFRTDFLTKLGFLGPVFETKGGKMLKFFTVTDPHYLRWALRQLTLWDFDGLKDRKVIQISAGRDAIFPITKQTPDYVFEDATHLFPITRARQLSEILAGIFV